MANKTIGKDVAQPRKLAVLKAELTGNIPLATDTPPVLLNVVDAELAENIDATQDVQDEKYVIPLDGKWILTDDSTHIGKNFSVLTNMRYVGSGPDKIRLESVRGMSRINSAALNGTSFPRSAFHFRKSQPVETHVLVQAYGTTGTCSTVSVSTFAIPFAGSFGTAGTTGVFASAIWSDSTAGTGGTQRRGQWSDAPNGHVAYCNGIDTCVWGGSEMRVGAFIHNGTVGNGGMGGTASTFSDDYTEKMANINTDSDNIISLTLGTDGTCNLQIGSVRQLQAVKLYVQSANTSAGTASGLYWDGTTEQLMTINDNTASAGVTLAQTGTIAFSSTITTAKLRYLEGRLLYFYHFRFANLTTNTQLYACTLDAPFQNLYDLWDGVYRRVAAFYKRTTTYFDATLNVRDDLYVESDADQSSYIDLASFAAFSEPDNALETQFAEKQTGFLFHLPIGHVNTTAATSMSIDYWDGKQYLTVGSVVDGTSENSISLAKGGVASWYNSSLTNEVKKSINNGIPLYSYRIRFNQALSSTVRLYYVAGMSASNKISGYSFAIQTNERLMLGCDNYGKKNALKISAKNQPNVFNGIDTFDVEFGDDKALTCGISLYAQYASNIFNLALLFKTTETWILSWIEQLDGTIWERFRISPFIGCPAPLTLKSASVAFDKNTNQTKQIGIWRGNNGIYLSDSHAPLEVSDDIRAVFDQTKTPHVNLAMVAHETSFVDHDLEEYHWQWASGTSTELDKEYILNLRIWRWFEVDRGSGNRIQLGIPVTDSDGNHYAYGFTDSGFMHRLEYGTTFHGSDGTSAIRIGDQLPVPQDLFSETTISRANLIAVAKATDNTITLKHYIDGGTSGTYSLSDADPTRRYANQIRDIYSTAGIFHGFGMEKVWNDETKAFEPLYFAVYYKKARDKTK